MRGKREKEAALGIFGPGLSWHLVEQDLAVGSGKLSGRWGFLKLPEQRSGASVTLTEPVDMSREVAAMMPTRL